MTLARLLAAALVVCSLPALTQDNRNGGPAPGNTHGHRTYFPSCCATAATPSEPWRLIPNQASAAASTMAAVRIGQYKVDSYQLDNRGKIFLPYRIGSGGDPLNEYANNDTTCYAIRSYVVARDAKDSDSTHPTGYSTCRPSDRYHVKSAEIRVDSGKQ